MKVVILCGGMGTRLREETEFRPKSMVKIGAKPILWHIMKHYAYHGFKEFVLCLGYKGEVIKEYFYHYMLHNNDVTVKLGKDRQITIHENDQVEDWEITMVDTGENTLKGGRIHKIQKYVDDDFMVTYGDGVSDINISELVSFHKNHGKIGTVTGVSPRSSYGQIKSDNGKVLGFIEKPKIEEGMINGGFFVFQKSIFDYLNSNDDCDFEIGPLEQLTQEGQLMVYHHKGDWACMDTYRDSVFLNDLWKKGQAFWKV
ncbi:MAG: glucose-1-phosphate cytidylyltransferase [Nitrospinota bacterium]